MCWGKLHPHGVLWVCFMSCFAIVFLPLHQLQYQSHPKPGLQLLPVPLHHQIHQEWNPDFHRLVDKKEKHIIQTCLDQRHKYYDLTKALDLTLKRTTTQVVETSTVTNSSLSEDYSHPDNHTRQTTHVFRTVPQLMSTLGFFRFSTGFAKQSFHSINFKCSNKSRD